MTERSGSERSTTQRSTTQRSTTTGQRELDAAGITDPGLRASYAACRRVNAAHGRTYHLATLLLPPSRRPAVHALYGFARAVDDVVDDVGVDVGTAMSPTDRSRILDAVGAAVRDATGDSDPTGWPVLPALRDTVARHCIPWSHLDDFLAAMRSDLTVTHYETWRDLLGYMHGSAAAIGLELLPVLGTVPGMQVVAEPYARDLGHAFQLANFIRDVGEDLRRGRVYLPAEDLAHVGVTREQLAGGVVDGRVRRLLAFEIARARELFRAAAPGIRLLDPASRDCVRTAFVLYGGILDAVERAGYQVLDRRVAVGPARRLAVAVPGLVRAHHARRGSARRSRTSRTRSVPGWR